MTSAEASEEQSALSLVPRIAGEQEFLSVTLSRGSDGVALAYPVDEDGIPIRCAFCISNYRTIIVPMRGTAITVPHMMLDSWELERHGMNATQRAAFPQAHPAHPSSTPQQVPIQQPQAFTLTLTSKYLWNFKVIFQDERQASTARKLIDSLRPNHLSRMPAFEHYTFRNETIRVEKEVDGEVVEETAQSPRSASNRRVFPSLGGENSSSDGATAPMVNYGWNIYDCKKEMIRQITVFDPSSPIPPIAEDESSGKHGIGVDLRNWFRATNLLQEDNMYGRSPTYPFFIVAPNALSDAQLVECIYARSRGRIPAISFVHLGTGAVLARCSQPLSKGELRKDADVCAALVNNGYTVMNCKPRENRPLDPYAALAKSVVAPPPSLIETSSFASAASSAAPSGSRPSKSRTLMVADCRPQAAAFGNQTMGGGYENGSTHDFCRVKFHGIDNIHGVTKSFNKLKTLITQFNGKFARENFYAQLHETQWLYHIQRVLMCSLEIAEGLDRGESFLVHCTDGWDRTSQCTSIAMLLLDPFYRTTLGFCTLLEKEFCVFGHKFAERCSHMVPGDTFYTNDSGVSASDTESQQAQQAHKLQPSPIFVQWLDCIFQIVRQFPNRFEFTPKLLERLSQDVYSCWYGTFLANSDKERIFEGVKLKTMSLWTDVLDDIQAEKRGSTPLTYLNEFYNAEEAWRFVSKKENSGIQFLPISCSSKRLVFWDDFYLKFDSDNLSICVVDLRLNSEVDSRKRTTSPYYSAELEAYLESRIDEAKSDRGKDVKYMEELLTRLQVQRPPPAPVAAKSVVAHQPLHHAAPIDTKSCWHCHDRFGLFQFKEYCALCPVKAPLCSKCVVIKSGKKFCVKCTQMVETMGEE